MSQLAEVSLPPTEEKASGAVTMLIAGNAFIRAGVAGSGQMFAFYLAGGRGGGFGSLVVGLVGAFFYITELFGAPLAGRLADRYGQGRVLAVGPLFSVLSVLVAAMTALGGPVGAAIALCLAARVLGGVGTSCTVPTTLTLLSRATEGDQQGRARVMGWFEVTSLVGMILGYALAGAVWDLAVVSWERFAALSFLLFVPIYLLSALFISSARARREPRWQESEKAPPAPAVRQSFYAGLRPLLARRGNIAFGLAWIAINAVVGLWLSHAPYLFNLEKTSESQRLIGGLSGSEIGTIFGGFGLLLLVGTMGWAFLAGHWARRRALAVSLLGMLGVVASLAAVNHGAPRWVLGITALFVLVESGFTPAALAHLADLTAEHDQARGASMGVYSFLLSAGQLLGSAAGGFFAAWWQMDGVLLATALLAGSALGFVSWMERGADYTTQGPEDRISWRAHLWQNSG